MLQFVLYPLPVNKIWWLCAHYVFRLNKHCNLSKWEDTISNILGCHLFKAFNDRPIRHTSTMRRAYHVKLRLFRVQFAKDVKISSARSNNISITPRQPIARRRACLINLWTFGPLGILMKYWHSCTSPTWLLGDEDTVWLVFTYVCGNDLTSVKTVVFYTIA